MLRGDNTSHNTALGMFMGKALVEGSILVDALVLDLELHILGLSSLFTRVSARWRNPFNYPCRT